MMLTNMASVLRVAGLKVQEISGWKTRGHGEFQSIESIIIHHTAGPKTGNYPSLNTVLDGRPGLDGPLGNLGLARDGTWIVIAAGVAWHAGDTFHEWQNNWHAIGIEAEGTGVDPWPKVQYDSYTKGTATLAHAYDVRLGRVLGHKEVAEPLGRKNDPNFDMTTFRAAVARGGGGSTPPKTGDWFDMATPAEIEAAVAAGTEKALRTYGAAFFKDESGTGDTLWDESRAYQAALMKKLDELIAAIKQAA